DNSAADVAIWVNGNLKNSAQAEVHITSNAHTVTFNVNGNFDMEGGGIYNDAATTAAAVKPENLTINITKAGTSMDIGGSPTVAAHVNAPGTDVKVHGNSGKGTSGFFGAIIGKTLTVDGNMELHYDETGHFNSWPYKIHLV